METRRLVCLAMSLVLTLAAGRLVAQEPAPPPSQEPEALEPPTAEAGSEEQEEIAGPTPGAPTVGLATAVRIALERNFGLLDSVDSVQSARYRESAAGAQFYPRLTPRYQRSEDTSTFSLDLSQRLPWSGGALTASGSLSSAPRNQEPFPRSSELRLLLTQPLLRGFGPNTTYFDLKNSRRSRQAQERSLELARQRLAVQVTAAFYNVIAQRQLLAVSRQSLRRSESLRRSSEARLKVGLVSKLDVFRTELQAAQTRDSMVRSQAALENALEQFRLLLALPPGEALEPEAVSLPAALESSLEPIEVLVQRALDNRLELKESRDLLDDARRSAALARQNLLPQLDLNLGVAQSGFGNTLGEALRAADTRVDVFVTASYPLERSSEKANRAVAEIELAAHARGVREQELEIESEVRAAARELERIRKSVELQRQGVEVAAQQRRLAVLRYQRGLASNFDVVDAEDSLVLARSALVGLLTSYNVALLDLKRATGVLDVEAEFGP